MNEPRDRARIEAIREFFLEDDLMASFVENMQVGERAWSSVLDHSGRLVIMPPDRSQVFTVQPGSAGFDCVEFADPFEAFDPDATLSRDPEASSCWIVAQGGTPREAFEGLVRLHQHFHDDDFAEVRAQALGELERTLSRM